MSGTTCTRVFVEIDFERRENISGQNGLLSVLEKLLPTSVQVRF